MADAPLCPYGQANCPAAILPPAAQVASGTRCPHGRANCTTAILPPVVRDERGLAFAIAADHALAVNEWQACPARVGDAADEVLWELARQYDVAGPLYRAMADVAPDKDRAKKEALVNSAPLLQRRRGTRWAVAEIMRLLGYSDAAVVDRTALLTYNGDANHDGTHFFDAGFSDWREYRIRLFLEAGCRDFYGDDMAQAAALVEAWAPLRSRLVGWNARHVLSTAVCNPENEKAKVREVVLWDKSQENRQAVDTFWAQAQPDGSWIIRWKLERQHIDNALSEVSTVALRLSDQTYLSQTLPAVAVLSNVTYEGAWTLKRQE